QGHNITLKNIIVTGTIQSNGVSNGSNAGNITIYNATTTSITANGHLSTTGNGGNGGIILLATSTTGAITVNGGGGTGSVGNGGNGGTVNATSTTSTAPSTPIIANGANASTCGSGGNGGHINLSDSTSYTTSVTAGNGAGSCGGNGTSGETSSYSTPPPTPPSAPYNPPAESNTPSGGGGTNEYVPGVTHFISPFNSPITLPINLPGTLKLPTLPTFGGTSTNSFSLKDPLSFFLFSPLPDPIPAFLKQSLAFKNFLTGLGVSYSQDLAKLHTTSLTIPHFSPSKLPPGLFAVSSLGKALPSTLTSNTKYPLIESISILPGVSLDLSLIPIGKGKVTGTITGRSVTFSLDKTSTSKTPPYLLSLATPSAPGTYYLTSASTPIVLQINIVSPPTAPTSPSSAKPPNLWQKVLKLVGGWFGRK
ncbi:MAG: hypothetical protein PHF79_03320, partial [Candidatus Pacebacteria bacterium]|nr:hypothetical protein [Candidatus Paceibacterota bacterium]